jgi:prophage antirepressor-like protein
MNEVMTFSNSEFGAVRSVMIDGEPWFVGNDVAKALEYKDLYSATRHNVDDEDKRLCPISSTSGMQDTVIVNESGLYSMIFGSKLKQAKKFKHWVTSEVLPALRKNGTYTIQQKQDSYMIDDPIKRAERWIEEAKERKALEDKNRVLTKQAEEMKPKSDYFDSLVDSNLLTNFRDTAKELGYSPTEFTGWLLEKGYIYKDNAGIIKPYEPYRKQGLFVMKDFKNKYSGYSGVRTYVTVKGKNTFRLLMQVPDETVVLY